MRIKNITMCVSLAAFAFMAAPIAAQEQAVLKPLDVAKVEGTYAGTFLCSLGEMGMSLTLTDAGVAAAPMDIGQEPCASGAGPCNDRQNALLAKTRKTTGILNFFPTVGNPGAPKGAFRVSGWVDYSSKYFKKMEFQPGDWLDQPEGFGSSAMTGRLSKGVIYGKPTAQGCHTLKLHKIQTWSK